MVRHLCFVAVLLVPSALPAHPLYQSFYDRTVTVRVTERAVVVDYVLEVDSTTVYLDMRHLVSREEMAAINRQEDVFRIYHEKTAPLLLANLDVQLDGKPLTLRCTAQRWNLKDQHPAFEFRLECGYQLSAGSRHRLVVREQNFAEEKGAVRMSLAADGVTLHERTQPDKALLARAAIDLRPGDEDRLRTVAATFEVAGQAAPPGPDEPAATAASDTQAPARSLQDLLFQSDLGLWLLLGLAALLGGAHALTPGHGKTLVAAYLVGQRGTVWHAVLLGLVTAITHTGAVLLVAAFLPHLFPGASPASVHAVLAFVGGLLIAGLGFWLLMRRLSGQADHVHLFGGHHEHHHQHGHTHHHHPPDQPVTLWGLVTLGIAGGIVPCGEAVVLLTLAVQWQRLDLALPLLLAFSAGLAAVLVGVGVGVVWARRWSIDRWGESPRVQRITRALPVVSAVVITVLGVWLMYQAVQGGDPAH
jgi:ABC-type nickel/cobalt efflux system permease component RcnA